MKLKNKLIPLMSIIASTTVVAPIATSCKTTSTTDGVDITSPYAPTEAKAETITEEREVSEIQDLYMNHVMANPEILKQDILYFESQKLPSRINELEHMYVTLDGEFEKSSEQQSTITNVVANINISDVEVKRVDAVIKDEESHEGKKTQFYTLSMNIGYDFSFRATSLSTEPRILLDETIKYQSTYKDVPIYVTANDEYWYCSVDLLDEGIDEYLKYVPGWYVNYDYSMGYTANISTHGLSQDFSDTYANNGSITRRSQIYALKEAGSTLLYSLQDYYPNFGSYHLSNVALPASASAFKFASNKFNFNKSNIEAPLNEVYFDDIYLFKASDELYKILNSQECNHFKIMCDTGDGWDNDFYLKFDDEYYDPNDSEYEYTDFNCEDYNSSSANGKLGQENQLTYSDIYIYTDTQFRPNTSYSSKLTIQAGSISFAIVAYADEAENNVLWDNYDTPYIPKSSITISTNLTFVE